MKKLQTLIPAEYSYRNYPSGRFCVAPATKVVDSEVTTKTYRGFEIAFIERTKVSNGEVYDYVLQTINGEKVNLGANRARTYIDSKISHLFEKINGNKQSCLDDIFFTKESYINKMNNEDLFETASRLLINARYNGKQINWCFDYLYKKGMSIQDLTKFL
tara:strand:+ start:49 stop:528 length:480 start_codon:yes stop_codon:yes gene_type:complete